ncbi:MAG TPA: calcium-binding protein, partial [Bosea sp. (in: a-proteobacteria)]|uniref:calcium-binding protein n=1 Tax=Bosea sp. (in: a-proteobacteria) TaxID=1871050 RepID=UPI002E0EED95|nr:calcium-binding protein [Bosea sp. (in: a-proteobacteria)]
DDVIAGGEGDDEIEAGAGDDVVDAGTGDDEIDGGDGNDVIQAGDGDDEIAAGDGDDIADAGAGDDKVEGEDGDDVLYGGAGSDCLIGADGEDVLRGDSGNDVLKGGDGDDSLDGGQGCDTVIAGAGDDVVIASLDAAADCLDGGSGTDTLDLSGTSCGVTVDLTEKKAVGIEIGSDTVVDFEALIGGDGDDRFIVGSSSMVLSGGGGDDRFEFHVPEEAQNDLIHQILDLHEGDRIVIKQYEIHSDAAAGGTEIDPFSETYGDSGEDGRPFRFRIEKINDEERTYIDVFATQQDDKDLSIEIYGNHKLYYYSY